MTRVKIYNLTDHWFPDKIGGSCIYAYELHRLLSAAVPVETVTLLGEPSDRESDMIVHKVLHKSKFWRNRAVLKDLDADDVTWIVHSPWFFLHLFFALGFGVRRRLVGIYHGPWYREYFVSAAAKRNVLVRGVLSAVRFAIELLYSLVVPQFVFLSETMYRATSALLPIAKSKVAIIPMWSTQACWDRSRPPGHPLLLSTFRRLEPRMGLQDLLAALDRCDLQAYRLVICGDGPFKRRLADLIESMNLSDRVELRGWVTAQEKLSLIRSSDAVVIPSRSLEGFSLLALEALESGTPVVLTETVGFYEYVRNFEQDYVHKIDLKASKIPMHQFLTLGQARCGLDRIESLFQADQIRSQFLRLVQIGS